MDRQEPPDPQPVQPDAGSAGRPGGSGAAWLEQAAGGCERPASLGPPAPGPTRPRAPSNRIALATWMRALQERRATPEEALATMLRRVRAHPNERTLAEALELVNELSRRPDAQAAVRASVTQALIDELTGGSG